MPIARQTVLPGVKKCKNLNAENAVTNMNRYIATSRRSVTQGMLLRNSGQFYWRKFECRNRKRSHQYMRELKHTGSLVITFKFVLLLFVFAATLITVGVFLHATLATFLIVVFPEARFNQLIHAIMKMHGGANGRGQVDKR